MQFKKEHVSNQAGMDEILLGLETKIHEALHSVRSATAAEVGAILIRSHNRRFNEYDRNYLFKQVCTKLCGLREEGVVEAVDGTGVRGNPFSFAVVDDLPERSRRHHVKAPFDRNGVQVVSQPRKRHTAVQREKESNPSATQRKKYVNVAVSSVLMQIQTAEALYGKEYAEEIRNRLLTELKAK